MSIMKPKHEKELKMKTSPNPNYSNGFELDDDVDIDLHAERSAEFNFEEEFNHERNIRIAFNVNKTDINNRQGTNTENIMNGEYADPCSRESTVITGPSGPVSQSALPWPDDNKIFNTGTDNLENELTKNENATTMASAKECRAVIGNLTWWTKELDIFNKIIDIGVTDCSSIKFFENRSNGQSLGICVISTLSPASINLILDKLPQEKIHQKSPKAYLHSKQIVAELSANAQLRGNYQEKCMAINGGSKTNTNNFPMPMGYNPKSVQRMWGPRPGIGPPPGMYSRNMCPLNGRPPFQYRPPPPPPRMGCNNFNSHLPRPPPVGQHFPTHPMNGQNMPHYDRNDYIPMMNRSGCPPYNNWNQPPMVPQIPRMGSGPPSRTPMINPKIFNDPPWDHVVNPEGPPFGYKNFPPGGPSRTDELLSHGKILNLSGSNNKSVPHEFTSYGHPSPPSPPGTRQILCDRRNTEPKMSKVEIEEGMNKNWQTSSSAIARAVSEASDGDYAGAVETLVTAIALIKSSKISDYDNGRADVHVRSLQDTLLGVENKAYGIGRVRFRSRSPRRSTSRSRERKRERHERFNRRERSRNRNLAFDGDYLERIRSGDYEYPRNYRKRSMSPDRSSESHSLRK